MNRQGVCTVDGCENKRYAHELCRSCLRQSRIDQGICPNCLNPNSDGVALCQTCRQLKNNLRRQRKQNEKKLKIIKIRRTESGLFVQGKYMKVSHGDQEKLIEIFEILGLTIKHM